MTIYDKRSRISPTSWYYSMLIQPDGHL